MAGTISVWRAVSAVVVASIAAAGMAASASAAEPSLRLIAADRSISVSRVDLMTMDLGLWVAAEGGEVRIEARRPGYGPWQAEQVDPATGAPLRAIPRALVNGPEGLKRFLEIRFLDRKGHLAARRTLGLLPASAQRVSDDGPRVPTYSVSPFEGTGFPFTLGTVWGIDRGWAAPAAPVFFRGLPRRRLRLAPGRYRVLARVRTPFRRLFAMVPAQAHVQLRVRVRRGRPAGRPAPVEFFAPSPHSLARRAAAGPPDPASLPDLVALPPWGIGVLHRRHRDLLGFAATPWNGGPGALDVEGFRRPGTRVMPAEQYFIAPNGDVTGSAPAGEMHFHAGGGHNHWHFRQLVRYTLLTGGGEKVVTSRKQSFCIAPTDPVDLTVPGAEVAPTPFGLDASSCGDLRSIWLREALPAGWGDTYAPVVSGQDFDITHVPNGHYLVEMHVNPLGQLSETTTANDVARRRIVLRGRPGHRRVRVAAWHGIEG